jgi:hypothetical protein
MQKEDPAFIDDRLPGCPGADYHHHLSSFADEDEQKEHAGALAAGKHHRR